MSPRRAENPPLDRDLLSDDPIEQFAIWFQQAEADVPLDEAMTLATVDDQGSPDARMVLLKGFGPDGFRFFTNYESAKGMELAANPRAALVIYWRELDRQVRIRGAVERLSAADSDDYFASRPRDSRVAAAISPQSRPIERDQLERRYREMLDELANADPVRPDNWGGYLVRPDAIEFWQGRESRMHDRFLYTRKTGNEDGWMIERLAP
ncbi:MAG TPA: pyridoxamine 5'-phosphate oxidase [Solirubrobacterales bacterium]|nr:pyridoxamine 5'-phosphate oxidase [Solirubrobacterales bacterium]